MLTDRFWARKMVQLHSKTVYSFLHSYMYGSHMSNTTPRYFPKTNKNICLCKELYINVYSKAVTNNPKINTI